MKPIKEAWCIQIELNNYCPHSCAYCTRFTHHLRQDQRYNMKLNELSYILEVMRGKGYKGKLGIIGGEPTVHPEFEAVCKVVKWDWTSLGLWLALWTSGGPRYEKYKPEIDECFSWVAYNDKADPMCHHQPLTMASCDIVPDAELRAELISDCWVQRIWCPSITPKGVFFCEVAAAWDRLLDGPGGWPIESDWQEYGPEDYKSQMWACELCGMCVPQEDAKLGHAEKISKTVKAEFEKHNIDTTFMQLTEDHVDREEYAARLSDDWAPGEYTPGRAKGGANV